MTDHDEFDGIFDSLTPDSFVITTSAIVTTDTAALGLVEQVGPRAFENFYKQQVAATRSAYKASEGQINPVAVLCNAETSYTFVPDDDESLNDYIGRLRREAQQLKATWFYMARMTLVGTPADDDRPSDTSDLEAIQRAVESGRMSQGVFFCAERREGADYEFRHAIARASEVAVLGMLVEGDPLMASPSLNVLG